MVDARRAHGREHSPARERIGRRLGAPVALEGALKLKEISYDHTEGFPAGELKHGPLALVTSETPVLAVLTDGSNARETLDNVKEVESRGAPVIVCTSDDVDAEKFVDELFEVPNLGKLEPLVANVYFQLYGYHVANLKGRSIDKPRNLARERDGGVATNRTQLAGINRASVLWSNIYC